MQASSSTSESEFSRRSSKIAEPIRRDQNIVEETEPPIVVKEEEPDVHDIPCDENLAPDLVERSSKVSVEPSISRINLCLAYVSVAIFANLHLQLRQYNFRLFAKLTFTQRLKVSCVIPYLKRAPVAQINSRESWDDDRDVQNERSQNSITSDHSSDDGVPKGLRKKRTVARKQKSVRRTWNFATQGNATEDDGEDPSDLHPPSALVGQLELRKRGIVSYKRFFESTPTPSDTQRLAPTWTFRPLQKRSDVNPEPRNDESIATRLLEADKASEGSRASPVQAFTRELQEPAQVTPTYSIPSQNLPQEQRQLRQTSHASKGNVSGDFKQQENLLQKPNIQVHYFIVRSRNPVFSKRHWKSGSLRNQTVETFFSEIFALTGRERITKISLKLKTSGSESEYVFGDGDQSTFEDMRESFGVDIRAGKVNGITRFETFVEPDPQEGAASMGARGHDAEKIDF